ncbi:MAG: MYXO-CTERM sorting domain-containing protein [Myxococcota bacterium]
MLLLPFPLAAVAATLDVSEGSASDYGSIGEALQQSSPGDVILVHPGAYTEIGALAVSHDVQIVGLQAGGARPVLSARSGGFFVVTAGTARIRGLDFTGAGTAIVQQGGTLDLQGSTFDGAHTGTSGGAIRQEGGTLLVRGCTFTDGDAVTDGGGLWVGNGAVARVEWSTFTGNTAQHGAALAVADGGGLSVERTRFDGNTASESGGAVFVDAEALALVVDGSTFGGNAAESGAGGGGAIQLLSTAPGSALRDSYLCDNLTEGYGGAVNHQAGQLGVTGSAFVRNENTSARGGAIRSTGELAVVSGTFVGNSGLSHGAVLFNGSGSSLSQSLTRSVIGPHTGEPDVVFSSNGAVTTAFDQVLVEQPGVDLGSWVNGSVDYGSTALGDPGGCDPADVVPPAGSDALVDPKDPSDDLGAAVDRDGDGWFALDGDCDDTLGTGADVHPGAGEVVADGVDQDCDGRESCYADLDGDGRGEDSVVPSDDLDCDDWGEASVQNDACVGLSDMDSDVDGICDDLDACPGSDDALDADEDGLPDGCDDCPADPTNTCTEPTGTGTETTPFDDRPPSGDTIGGDGSPPGCDCRTAPAPGAGWLALAALALLRRRRQRA